MNLWENMKTASSRNLNALQDFSAEIQNLLYAATTSASENIIRIKDSRILISHL